jgi:hypothetical protein
MEQTQGGGLPADAVSPVAAGKAVGVRRGTIMRWALGGKIKYWSVGGTRYFVSLAEVKAQVQPGWTRPRDRPASDEALAAAGLPAPEPNERRRRPTLRELARQRRTQDILRQHGLA